MGRNRVKEFILRALHVAWEQVLKAAQAEGRDQYDRSLSQSQNAGLETYRNTSKFCDSKM